MSDVIFNIERSRLIDYNYSFDRVRLIDVPFGGWFYSGVPLGALNPLTPRFD